MEGKAKHHLMRILWLKKAVVIPLQIASSRCRDSASGVDFHTRTMIGHWQFCAKGYTRLAASSQINPMMTSRSDWLQYIRR
jgi:hypothetical protein